MKNDNTLIYSTAVGRIRQPADQSVCPKGDGIVRIGRQSSGRKGKGVCIITGIEADNETLSRIAAMLKKKCGCGGAVKGSAIEIQGDKRELIKRLLEAEGMKVKLAGG